MTDTVLCLRRADSLSQSVTNQVLVPQIHSSNRSPHATSPGWYLVQYIFNLKCIYLFAPVFSTGLKPQTKPFFQAHILFSI